MHKILAVGDMHLKQSKILPYVKAAAEKNGVDTIVFMGDYVDDYLATDEQFLYELDYHVKWYEKFKKSFEIINLCGNHDWSYLNQYGLVASGYRAYLNPDVKNSLESLDICIAYAYDNILFTHAGITSNWAESTGIDTRSAYSCYNDLQLMFESNNNSLNSCSESRGGTDKFAGPLWCDQSDINSSSMQEGMPFNQVVGHTPMKHICNDVYKNGTSCTFIDTFSLKRNGDAFGDGSILLLSIDDKERIGKGEIGCKETCGKSWETIAAELKRSMLRMYDWF